MTVSDLIRELQAMPNQHAPVRVRIEIDDPSSSMEEADVDRVVHEGPFVALELR